VSARVRTQDPRVFRFASDLLDQFKHDNPRLRATNFAVALSVFSRRSISSSGITLNRPGGGPSIDTGDLQSLCDATYEKVPGFDRATADAPIYKLFSGEFKPRSPRSNNWRNAFDLQTGLGCDAPWDSSFLQSGAYLDEQRFYCPFRTKGGVCDSSTGFASGTPRHCFMPNKRGKAPGPDTIAASPPKLLARGFDADGGGRGYWYVEPTLGGLALLLGDPTQRVPVYPFLVVFYGGTVRRGIPGLVSPQFLQNELKLTSDQFLTLFDVDRRNRLNAALLLNRSPGPAPKREPPARKSDGSVGTTYRRRDVVQIQRDAAAEPDPERRRELLERATNGHIETLDSVARYLKRRGYTCREQQSGFDLYARSSGRAVLLEVKTWTQSNLTKQCRSGLAQLLEYEFRNREVLRKPVDLCLVLDREPPASRWLWRFLRECGVLPAWIEGGTLQTFDLWRSELP
jgi:hypothetical protein